MESKKKLTVQYKELLFEAFLESDGTYRCLILADMFPHQEKKELSRDDVVSELSQLCPIVPIAILDFFVKIGMKYESVLKITRNNSMFINLSEVIFIQYSATAFGCTIGCENKYERFISMITNKYDSLTHPESVFGATLFYDVETIVAEKVIEEVMKAFRHH